MDFFRANDLNHAIEIITLFINSSPIFNAHELLLLFFFGIIFS